MLVPAGHAHEHGDVEGAQGGPRGAHDGLVQASHAHEHGGEEGAHGGPRVGVRQPASGRVDAGGRARPCTLKGLGSAGRQPRCVQGQHMRTSPNPNTSLEQATTPQCADPPLSTNPPQKK